MATSLIRNSAPLTPYRRAMLRALWWSSRGGAVSYERGTPVGLNLAARACEPTAERCSSTRQVDVRLPGKGNSNPHGAKLVHLIITMIKWNRTSRLSIKNSLSVFKCPRTRGGQACVSPRQDHLLLRIHSE